MRRVRSFIAEFHNLLAHNMHKLISVGGGCRNARRAPWDYSLSFSAARHLVMPFDPSFHGVVACMPASARRFGGFDKAAALASL